MASASVQRGGARAPPTPDQLASFYKLVDKQIIAGQLFRHARHAELSSDASQTAEALFGDDSLVVADLFCCECGSLTNLAGTASGAEQKELIKKASAILVSLISVLQRRLASNTLLPGSIREEELDFEVHAQLTLKKIKNKAVPPPAALRAAASTMGYNTLLLAIFTCLNLLPGPFWSAAQKWMVESFVLQGLDVIPLTAGISANKIVGEDDIVSWMEEDMNPRDFDPAFCIAVLRKWRSHAVSSALQARGVLQTGAAKYEQDKVEFKARQLADVAKHGLRDCALPSCAKTEKTVKEFKLCAGCRSQVYCCLEHQALDWRAHKKECREKEAARLAEEEAAYEGTDAGTVAA